MGKYNLKEDHANIKKQIKEWEISSDWVVQCLLNIQDELGDIQVNEDGQGKAVHLTTLIEEVEGNSHEMMTINL